MASSYGQCAYPAMASFARYHAIYGMVTGRRRETRTGHSVYLWLGQFGLARPLLVLLLPINLKKSKNCDRGGPAGRARAFGRQPKKLAGLLRIHQFFCHFSCFWLPFKTKTQTTCTQTFYLLNCGYTV